MPALKLALAIIAFISIPGAVYAQPALDLDVVHVSSREISDARSHLREKLVLVKVRITNTSKKGLFVYGSRSDGEFELFFYRLVTKSDTGDWLFPTANGRPKRWEKDSDESNQLFALSPKESYELDISLTHKESFRTVRIAFFYSFSRASTPKVFTSAEIESSSGKNRAGAALQAGTILPSGATVFQTNSIVKEANNFENDHPRSGFARSLGHDVVQCAEAGARRHPVHRLGPVS